MVFKTYKPLSVKDCVCRWTWPNVLPYSWGHQCLNSFYRWLFHFFPQYSPVSHQVGFVPSRPVSWGWEGANQHSLCSAFLLFGGTGTLGLFTSGTFLVFGELPVGIRNHQGWTQDASGWNLIAGRKGNPDGINGTLSHLHMISLHFRARLGALCLCQPWPWWLIQP